MVGLADSAFCYAAVGAVDVLGDPCECSLCLFTDVGLKNSESVCQVVCGGFLNKLRDEVRQTAKPFQAVANFSVGFVVYASFGVGINLAEAPFNDSSNVCFEGFVDER